MELLLLYLSAIDDARFKVIARSSVGQAEVDSRLPFFETRDRWRTTLIKALEVNEFRSSAFQREGEQDWLVEQGLLSKDRESFHPTILARIGQAMYEALFPVGEVRNVLQRAIAQAEGNETQLHIQLEFNAEITKRSRLPDYPWELVHDGQKFLAHHQVRFSRYIAHPASVTKVPLVQKLNVLLVSSTASDEDHELLPLSRKEQQAVLKGLKKAEEEGLIQVNELKPATLNQLRIYLTNNRAEQSPHVFHFDGHGLFGRRCNVDSCRTIHKDLSIEKCKTCGATLPDEPQGYLLFETEENDENEADYISAIELGQLLQKTSFGGTSTQKNGVTVAVLSACKSGMALGGESVFNGVAQRLISHRIPAVVAMQYTIRVDSAMRFSEQFYRALGSKNSSLAIAISQGQEAMGAEGNQWYRPVLYLRWQDDEGGQLFAPPQPRVDTFNKLGDSQKHQQEHTGRTIKKTILMLSANPESIDRLRREEEIKTIENALGRATLARVKQSRSSTVFDSLLNKLNVRATDLSQELSTIQSSCICISGDEDGIEGLMLGSNFSKSESNHSGKLKSIVDFFRLHSERIDCVILNGCYSEEQARGIVQHIEFVIGISRELEHEKVIRFLSEFYYQLSLENTIQSSYSLGYNLLERVDSENTQLLPTLLRRDDERKRKRLEEELIDCNKKIEHDQDNVELWRKKASLLKELDRSEEAAQAYERASSLDPNNYKIRVEQGDALERFGKHEKAVNAYDKALELEQEDYKVWWKKGQALAEARQYSEAAKSYDKAVTLKPPSPDNYMICREYGCILKKLEQYQNSVNSYKKSLSFEPRYRASSYEKRQVYKKKYFRKGNS
ncbi:CHAT domain-containing tetratricopeptide repeat protein [Leptolyngbya ohadii]|uniref:CHAT domain-containing tetratricopeptide repeat protein n=1 Tax=Leptolyngbya ohadii TaxID=1962290 RepID=UPI000B59A86B|nr:CHAT domain-containing protein [Leptolyngbya ohadii]